MRLRPQRSWRCRPHLSDPSPSGGRDLPPSPSAGGSVRSPTIRRVIERIPGLADGVIGIRAVGTFSVDDYAATIEPELERLETAHRQLRLLLQLGPEFEGFGEGAWGDLTGELRSTPFHRGAVV